MKQNIKTVAFSNSKQELITLDYDDQDAIVCFNAQNKYVLLLTQKGEVYKVGDISGHKSLISEFSKNQFLRHRPQRFLGLNREKISQIACSNSVALLLSNNGALYSCGNDGYHTGVLGFGQKTNTINTPTVIPELKRKSIKQFSVGDKHAAAIDSRGHIYTWGSGSCEELGYKGSIKQQEPKQLNISELYGAKKVFTKNNLTCVITGGGSVYFMGNIAKADIKDHSRFNLNLPESEYNLDSYKDLDPKDIVLHKPQSSSELYFKNLIIQNEFVVGLSSRQDLIFINKNYQAQKYIINQTKFDNLLCSKQKIFTISKEENSLYEWDIMNINKHPFLKAVQKMLKKKNQLLLTVNQSMNSSNQNNQSQSQLFPSNDLNSLDEITLPPVIQPFHESIKSLGIVSTSDSQLTCIQFYHYESLSSIAMGTQKSSTNSHQQLPVFQSSNTDINIGSRQPLISSKSQLNQTKLSNNNNNSILQNSFYSRQDEPSQNRKQQLRDAISNFSSKDNKDGGMDESRISQKIGLMNRAKSHSNNQFLQDNNKSVYSNIRKESRDTNNNDVSMLSNLTSMTNQKKYSKLEGFERKLEKKKKIQKQRNLSQQMNQSQDLNHSVDHMIEHSINHGHSRYLFNLNNSMNQSQSQLFQHQQQQNPASNLYDSIMHNQTQHQDQQQQLDQDDQHNVSLQKQLKYLKQQNQKNLLDDSLHNYEHQYNLKERADALRQYIHHNNIQTTVDNFVRASPHRTKSTDQQQQIQQTDNTLNLNESEINNKLKFPSNQQEFEQYQQKQQEIVQKNILKKYSNQNDYDNQKIAKKTGDLFRKNSFLDRWNKINQQQYQGKSSSIGKPVEYFMNLINGQQDISDMLVDPEEDQQQQRFFSEDANYSQLQQQQKQQNHGHGYSLDERKSKYDLGDDEVRENKDKKKFKNKYKLSNLSSGTQEQQQQDKEEESDKKQRKSDKKEQEQQEQQQEQEENDFKSQNQKRQKDFSNLLEQFGHKKGQSEQDRHNSQQKSEKLRSIQSKIAEIRQKQQQKSKEPKKSSNFDQIYSNKLQEFEKRKQNSEIPEVDVQKLSEKKRSRKKKKSLSNDIPPEFLETETEKGFKDNIGRMTPIELVSPQIIPATKEQEQRDAFEEVIDRLDHSNQTQKNNKNNDNNQKLQNPNNVSFGSEQNSNFIQLEEDQIEADKLPQFAKIDKMDLIDLSEFQGPLEEKSSKQQKLDEKKQRAIEALLDSENLGYEEKQRYISALTQQAKKPQNKAKKSKKSYLKEEKNSEFSVIQEEEEEYQQQEQLADYILKKTENNYEKERQDIQNLIASMGGDDVRKRPRSLEERKKYVQQLLNAVNIDTGKKDQFIQKLVRQYSPKKQSMKSSEQSAKKSQKSSSYKKQKSGQQSPNLGEKFEKFDDDNKAIQEFIRRRSKDGFENLSPVKNIQISPVKKYQEIQKKQTLIKSLTKTLTEQPQDEIEKQENIEKLLTLANENTLENQEIIQQILNDSQIESPEKKQEIIEGMMQQAQEQEIQDFIDSSNMGGSRKDINNNNNNDNIRKMSPSKQLEKMAENEEKSVNLSKSLGKSLGKLQEENHVIGQILKEAGQLNTPKNQKMVKNLLENSQNSAFSQQIQPQVQHNTNVSDNSLHKSQHNQIVQEIIERGQQGEPLQEIVEKIQEKQEEIQKIQIAPEKKLEEYTNQKQKNKRLAKSLVQSQNLQEQQELIQEILDSNSQQNPENEAIIQQILEDKDLKAPEQKQEAIETILEEALESDLKTYLNQRTDLLKRSRHQNIPNTDTLSQLEQLANLDSKAQRLAKNYIQQDPQQQQQQSGKSSSIVPKILRESMLEVSEENVQKFEQICMNDAENVQDFIRLGQQGYDIEEISEQVSQKMKPNVKLEQVLQQQKKLQEISQNLLQSVNEENQQMQQDLLQQIGFKNSQMEMIQNLLKAPTLKDKSENTQRQLINDVFQQAQNDEIQDYLQKFDLEDCQDPLEELEKLAQNQATQQNAQNNQDFTPIKVVQSLQNSQISQEYLQKQQQKEFYNNSPSKKLEEIENQQQKSKEITNSLLGSQKKQEQQSLISNLLENINQNTQDNQEIIKQILDDDQLKSKSQKKQVIESVISQAQEQEIADFIENQAQNKEKQILKLQKLSQKGYTSQEILEEMSKEEKKAEKLARLAIQSQQQQDFILQKEVIEDILAYCDLSNNPQNYQLIQNAVKSNFNENNQENKQILLQQVIENIKNGDNLQGDLGQQYLKLSEVIQEKKQLINSQIMEHSNSGKKQQQNQEIQAKIDEFANKIEGGRKKNRQITSNLLNLSQQIDEQIIKKNSMSNSHEGHKELQKSKRNFDETLDDLLGFNDKHDSEDIIRGIVNDQNLDRQQKQEIIEEIMQESQEQNIEDFIGQNIQLFKDVEHFNKHSSQKISVPSQQLAFLQEKYNNNSNNNNNSSSNNNSLGGSAQKLNRSGEVQQSQEKKIEDRLEQYQQTLEKTNRFAKTLVYNDDPEDQFQILEQMLEQTQQNKEENHQKILEILQDQSQKDQSKVQDIVGILKESEEEQLQQYLQQDPVVKKRRNSLKKMILSKSSYLSPSEELEVIVEEDHKIQRLTKSLFNNSQLLKGGAFYKSKILKTTQQQQKYNQQKQLQESTISQLLEEGQFENNQKNVQFIKNLVNDNQSLQENQKKHIIQEVIYMGKEGQELDEIEHEVELMKESFKKENLNRSLMITSPKEKLGEIKANIQKSRKLAKSIVAVQFDGELRQELVEEMLEELDINNVENQEIILGIVEDENVKDKQEKVRKIEGILNQAHQQEAEMYMEERNIQPNSNIMPLQQLEQIADSDLQIQPDIIPSQQQQQQQLDWQQNPYDFGQEEGEQVEKIKRRGIRKSSHKQQQQQQQQQDIEDKLQQFEQVQIQTQEIAQCIVNSDDKEEQNQMIQVLLGQLNLNTEENREKMGQLLEDDNIQSKQEKSLAIQDIMYIAQQNQLQDFLSSQNIENNKNQDPIVVLREIQENQVEPEEKLEQIEKNVRQSENLVKSIVKSFDTDILQELLEINNIQGEDDIQNIEKILGDEDIQQEEKQEKLQQIVLEKTNIQVDNYIQQNEKCKKQESSVNKYIMNEKDAKGIEKLQKIAQKEKKKKELVKSLAKSQNLRQNDSQLHLSQLFKETQTQPKQEKLIKEILEDNNIEVEEKEALVNEVIDEGELIGPQSAEKELLEKRQENTLRKSQNYQQSIQNLKEKDGIQSDLIKSILKQDNSIQDQDYLIDQLFISSQDTIQAKPQSNIKKELIKSILKDEDIEENEEKENLIKEIIQDNEQQQRINQILEQESSKQQSKTTTGNRSSRAKKSQISTSNKFSVHSINQDEENNNNNEDNELEQNIYGLLVRENTQESQIESKKELLKSIAKDTNLSNLEKNKSFQVIIENTPLNKRQQRLFMSQIVKNSDNLQQDTKSSLLSQVLPQQMESQKELVKSILNDNQSNSQEKQTIIDEIVFQKQPKTTKKEEESDKEEKIRELVQSQNEEIIKELVQGDQKPRGYLSELIADIVGNEEIQNEEKEQMVRSVLNTMHSQEIYDEKNSNKGEDSSDLSPFTSKSLKSQKSQEKNFQNLKTQVQQIISKEISGSSLVQKGQQKITAESLKKSRKLDKAKSKIVDKIMQNNETNENEKLRLVKSLYQPSQNPQQQQKKESSSKQSYMAQSQGAVDLKKRLVKSILKQSEQDQQQKEEQIENLLFSNPKLPQNINNNEGQQYSQQEKEEILEQILDDNVSEKDKEELIENIVNLQQSQQQAQKEEQENSLINTSNSSGKLEGDSVISSFGDQYADPERRRLSKEKQQLFESEQIEKYRQIEDIIMSGDLNFEKKKKELQKLCEFDENEQEIVEKLKEESEFKQERLNYIIEKLINNANNLNSQLKQKYIKEIAQESQEELIQNILSDQSLNPETKFQQIQSVSKSDAVNKEKLISSLVYEIGNKNDIMDHLVEGVKEYQNDKKVMIESIISDKKIKIQDKEKIVHALVMDPPQVYMKQKLAEKIQDSQKISKLEDKKLLVQNLIKTQQLSLDVQNEDLDDNQVKQELEIDQILTEPNPKKRTQMAELFIESHNSRAQSSGNISPSASNNNIQILSRNDSQQIMKKILTSGNENEVKLTEKEQDQAAQSLRFEDLQLQKSAFKIKKSKSTVQPNSKSNSGKKSQTFFSSQVQSPKKEYNKLLKESIKLQGSEKQKKLEEAKNMLRLSQSSQKIQNKSQKLSQFSSPNNNNSSSKKKFDGMFSPISHRSDYLLSNNQLSQNQLDDNNNNDNNNKSQEKKSSLKLASNSNSHSLIMSPQKSVKSNKSLSKSLSPKAQEILLKMGIQGSYLSPENQEDQEQTEKVSPTNKFKAAVQKMQLSSEKKEEKFDIKKAAQQLLQEEKDKEQDDFAQKQNLQEKAEALKNQIGKRVLEAEELQRQKKKMEEIRQLQLQQEQELLQRQQEELEREKMLRQAYQDKQQQELQNSIDKQMQQQYISPIHKQTSNKKLLRQLTGSPVQRSHYNSQNQQQQLQSVIQNRSQSASISPFQSMHNSRRQSVQQIGSLNQSPIKRVTSQQSQEKLSLQKLQDSYDNIIQNNTTQQQLKSANSSFIQASRSPSKEEESSDMFKGKGRKKKTIQSILKQQKEREKEILQNSASHLRNSFEVGSQIHTDRDKYYSPSKLVTSVMKQNPSQPNLTAISKVSSIKDMNSSNQQIHIQQQQQQSQDEDEQYQLQQQQQQYSLQQSVYSREGVAIPTPNDPANQVISSKNISPKKMSPSQTLKELRDSNSKTYDLPLQMQMQEDQQQQQQQLQQQQYQISIQQPTQQSQQMDSSQQEKPRTLVQRNLQFFEQSENNNTMSRLDSSMNNLQAQTLQSQQLQQSPNKSIQQSSKHLMSVDLDPLQVSPLRKVKQIRAYTPQKQFTPTPSKSRLLSPSHQELSDMIEKECEDITNQFMNKVFPHRPISQSSGNQVNFERSSSLSALNQSPLKGMGKSDRVGLVMMMKLEKFLLKKKYGAFFLMKILYYKEQARELKENQEQLRQMQHDMYMKQEPVYAYQKQQAVVTKSNVLLKKKEGYTKLALFLDSLSQQKMKTAIQKIQNKHKLVMSYNLFNLLLTNFGKIFSNNQQKKLQYSFSRIYYYKRDQDASIYSQQQQQQQLQQLQQQQQQEQSIVQEQQQQSMPQLSQRSQKAENIMNFCKGYLTNPTSLASLSNVNNSSNNNNKAKSSKSASPNNRQYQAQDNIEEDEIDPRKQIVQPSAQKNSKPYNLELSPSSNWKNNKNAQTQQESPKQLQQQQFYNMQQNEKKERKLSDNKKSSKDNLRTILNERISSNMKGGLESPKQQQQNQHSQSQQLYSISKSFNLSQQSQQQQIQQMSSIMFDNNSIQGSCADPKELKNTQYSGSMSGSSSQNKIIKMKQKGKPLSQSEYNQIQMQMKQEFEKQNQTQNSKKKVNQQRVMSQSSHRVLSPQQQQLYYNQQSLSQATGKKFVKSQSRLIPQKQFPMQRQTFSQTLSIPPPKTRQEILQKSSSYKFKQDSMQSPDKSIDSIHRQYLSPQQSIQSPQLYQSPDVRLNSQNSLSSHNSKKQIISSRVYQQQQQQQSFQSLPPPQQYLPGYEKVINSQKQFVAQQFQTVSHLSSGTRSPSNQQQQVMQQQMLQHYSSVQLPQQQQQQKQKYLSPQQSQYMAYSLQDQVIQQPGRNTKSQDPNAFQHEQKKEKLLQNIDQYQQYQNDYGYNNNQQKKSQILSQQKSQQSFVSYQSANSGGGSTLFQNQVFFNKAAKKNSEYQQYLK